MRKGERLFTLFHSTEKRIWRNCDFAVVRSDKHDMSVCSTQTTLRYDEHLSAREREFILLVFFLPLSPFHCVVVYVGCTGIQSVEVDYVWGKCFGFRYKPAIQPRAVIAILAR